MRAKLASWWKKAWARPDPWAQAEAELERFNELHPEWGKEIRLDQARHALESGLSEAVTRAAYPQEVDQILAERAALRERESLSEATEPSPAKRGSRARL